MNTYTGVSDASNYIDLIQLLASLQFGRTSHFKNRESFSLFLGETTPVFAGAAQAEEFLKQFSWRGGIFDELKINPFLNKFGVRLYKYKNLYPDFRYKFKRDGAPVDREESFVDITATEFFFNLVSQTLHRICHYQTRVASWSKGWANQIHAGLIDFGSKKAFTATAGAYEARGKELGGIRRAQAVNHSIFPQHDSWNIHSSELTNIESRIKLFEGLHLNSELVDDLISSGIYPLKPEDYYSNNLISYALSGSMANEISISNTMTTSANFQTPTDQCLLVDSNYQSVYSPEMFVNGNSLYGHHMHTLKLPAVFPGEGDYKMTRAKRKFIPKITVRNTEEIREIADALQKEFPDKKILYRGQNRHFTVPRTELVKTILYGSPDVDELSLPTSASRSDFAYDEFSAGFQLQIQGLIYSGIDLAEFSDGRLGWTLGRQTKCPFESKVIEDLYKRWKSSYQSFEWDVFVMAIAQHYGIPTHGLDITDNLEVALWFAVHKYFEYNDEGHTFSWYKDVEIINDNPFMGPVIYVLMTDLDLKRDLDDFDHFNVNALRPKRHNAFLHYGGWGLHTNICAEDVAAAIYFDREFVKPTLPGVEWYFPDVQEDPLYKFLLELKKESLEHGIKNYDRIAEYKNPKS